MIKHKRSILVILLGATGIVTAGAQAAGQGFYLGASAGYSALNTPGGDAFSVGTSTSSVLYLEDSATSDSGGFGGSVFAGYNVNQHLALELGYTKYANSNYSSTQSKYTGTPENYTLDGTPNSASLDYSTHTLDFFVKGTLPLIAQVSAFGKIGASYVMQEVTYTNPAGTPTINLDANKFATPTTGSSTEKALRPAAVFCISTAATENIATSLFAQGFYGCGDFSTDSSAIASAYLVGAGVTYSF